MNKKRLSYLTLIFWLLSSLSEVGSLAGKSIPFIVGFAVSKIIVSFIFALIIELVLSFVFRQK